MDDSEVLSPNLSQRLTIYKNALPQMDSWSWEVCVSVGQEARLLKDVSQWFLGFLAIKVATKYGKQSLKKYAIEIGVKPESLKVYRWVASKFPEMENQWENRLPFTLYQIAAHTEKPQEWVERAENENWTSSQLARELKEIGDPCTHEFETVELCNKCHYIKRLDK